METFSPYTRQFFERMDKPQVDEVRGIPPAIAIEQGNAVRTTRSTVGTLTEINDYLKLLFPRLATAQCPECETEVKPDTSEAAVRHALEAHAGESVLITFGIPVPAKTKPAEFFTFLQAQGYLRIFVYGELFRTDEPDAYTRKTLPAVVRVVQDRIKVSTTQKTKARLSEAVEMAFTLGKGKMTVIAPGAPKAKGERSFSRDWTCPNCDTELRAPTPGLFSFNNPLGACPDCRGFGRTLGIDLERALPDESLSIEGGVVKAFHGDRGAECQDDLLRCAKVRGVDLDTPFGDLPKADREWILYGEKGNPEENWQRGEWYGVQGFFDWMETKAYKMHVRVFLSRYRSTPPASDRCRGTRLQPEALNFQHRRPDACPISGAAGLATFGIDLVRRTPLSDGRSTSTRQAPSLGSHRDHQPPSHYLHATSGSGYLTSTAPPARSLRRRSSNGSTSPAASAHPQPTRFSSSTSQRLDCTRATSRCPRLRDARAARQGKHRCSSSNTRRQSCGPPTTSSTSARARENGGGDWSSDQGPAFQKTSLKKKPAESLHPPFLDRRPGPFPVPSTVRRKPKPDTLPQASAERAAHNQPQGTSMSTCRSAVFCLRDRRFRIRQVHPAPRLSC